MTDPAHDFLVRAIMQASSGLPEDAIVNDFAFHSPTVLPDNDLEGFAVLVSEFYRGVQANTKTVGEYISNFVNRAATHELAVYRIQADGSLNSPAFTMPWLGPPNSETTSGLPTEVAGVLSFHADLAGVLEESGATRPRARRRGRIYVGPLNASAVAVTVVPYLLSAVFLETLRQAAVTLMDVSGGLWSVWSRSDATLREVVGGWTDNAPDTQRRRGAQPSTRVTWG